MQTEIVTTVHAVHGCSANVEPHLLNLHVLRVPHGLPQMHLVSQLQGEREREGGGSAAS